MWRDYVGLVAPTAAIINGFIAVVVAQFYKDHPVAKALLVVMAGVLGVAAIGATFYGQYKVFSEKTADATRRRDIQESLGSFIQVGNELMRRCADPTQEVPLEEANKWADNVEAFLLNRLGRSYVFRFRDATGVVSMRLNSAKDEEHQNVWFGIYVRVARLEEFSREFPT
jgi:hypothetical protein